MKTHWRLPRGVDELLPGPAWQLERLRRAVLDEFHRWGFDYVEPPVIEYLESLLVGSGEDLDLQTLKVIDQISGRQLGVRADMTSQAARIDAHSLNGDGVRRLCYAGPVVFANPAISENSRVPFKAGAEIFGASGLEADAELISLMVRTMRVAGVDEPVLLLGHMGIFRGITEALATKGVLSAGDELQLFHKVQRKSASDIHEMLDDSPLSAMLAQLPFLMGDTAALSEARQVLAAAPASVGRAIDELEALADMVAGAVSGVQVRVDVSELSGYGYHNGAVFAVYHPQHGSALAQGGRYDGVGAVYGRARPATGFDVNLKNLIAAQSTVQGCIFAPFVAGGERAALQREIEQLREQQQRVRCALSAQESVPADCDRQLVWRDGQWRVEPVSAT